MADRVCRPAPRPAQRGEIETRTASRIEYSLTGARVQRGGCDAPIERDERVRRRIVGFCPAVVSFAYPGPLDSLAHHGSNGLLDGVLVMIVTSRPM